MRPDWPEGIPWPSVQVRRFVQSPRLAKRNLTARVLTGVLWAACLRPLADNGPRWFSTFEFEDFNKVASAINTNSICSHLHGASDDRPRAGSSCRGPKMRRAGFRTRPGIRAEAVRLSSGPDLIQSENPSAGLVSATRRHGPG